MESFTSYTQRCSRATPKNLLDFTPLSTAQKQHLSRVYAALCINVLLSGVGVYLHLNVLRLPTFLIVAIQLGCCLALSHTSSHAVRSRKVLTLERAGMFGGFAVCCGMTFADYLHFVHSFVSPTIITTAFFASVSVFACFSLAALLAKQREFLYLGSILGSALVYMSIISLVQIFFPTKIMHDVLVWGGLLAYVGFVVYDTQVTVVDFTAGNTDYLVHALQFYLDLVSIFIRIVTILSENKQKEQRRKRDNDE